MFDWLDWKHAPPTGFRFSTADGLVLAVAALSTPALLAAMPRLAAVPLYLVGHFFLFCNVVRMRRSYELLWAATFVAQTAAWLPWSTSLTAPLLAQLPVTLTLVTLEVRSDRYHGLFADPDRDHR